MKSADQKQRGASAVEFAILSPLFVALLFAIVEFGLVLYTKNMLTHASREGARFGVVYGTPPRGSAEIEAVVRNYLNQCGLTNPASVTITGVAGASGSPLDVKVDYTYRFFIVPQDLNQFFGGSLPTTLNLTAETVMLME